MKVLTYAELDVSRVKKQFAKVREALERDDFRTAEVKKLSPGQYYRAKLDDTNRLLLQFVKYQGKTVCLALEVIHQHAYEKSRFLRGAHLDESKLVDATPDGVEAAPVRYLNPARPDFHLQGKVISFDGAQEAVYRARPPLIVVGSAGSGKTALTLEKLRLARGSVLYVTHSAYLAQGARDLYFAHGYDNPDQEPLFLSYREFLETLRVPPGREVDFAAFRGWFAGHRQAYRFTDAHQVYEEFRGVLSSRPEGPLTREAYLALGVRQSIFPAEQRAAVHDLFEKYRAWLAGSALFDVNLVSFEWRELARPSYDFVVIDEAQDLTNVQLALILRTLRATGQFLLCGDANQIVHPNFFSWSAVKSLFWQDETLAERQQLSVLQVNFRNAREVTRVANTLLKVKRARFGSIDRESNFLVDSAAPDAGAVEFFPDKESVKRDLDARTRESTQFAVLVLRDEDKPGARAFFRTPLVFSVHEAKGLEYPNIILYNFISSQRGAYADIAEGVSPQDLQGDTLTYRRPRDKSDKSLEIYKFFVNALYVALTRAVERVIMIEQDERHPLLSLLGVRGAGEAPQLSAQKSSREDWEREARRLALQGKQEQADAIRGEILKVKPVPWEVWTEENVRRLKERVFDPKVPASGKLTRTLYEYAVWNGQDALLERLAQDAHYAPAGALLRGPLRLPDPAEIQRAQKALHDKYLAPYAAKNFKSVLWDCDTYGTDYRAIPNATPLMLAARAGNVALLEALLARGADPEARDDFGHTALMYALNRAFEDAAYAAGPFGAVYDLVAPQVLDVQVEGRLVRLYPHQAEYYFLSAMLAGLKTLRSRMSLHSDYGKRQRGFFVDHLQRNMAHFPPQVLREERRKRTYFNHVLSRAEVNSTYAPSRKLWVRVVSGHYLPNPALLLRVKGEDGQSVWKPIGEVLNLTWTVPSQSVLQGDV